MNAARLLAHYEQVADAPDAIARLRRFVLDLSVRGKLVPQASDDEPASELLKQIAKEKTRLVNAGEIRKPRDLDSSNKFDEPFAIPNTWEWVRLDALGAIIGGGTPSAADPENFTEPGRGVPWLTPADLGGYADLFIERGSRDLTEKGSRTSSATLMPKGTVLFTSRAPIGYVAIAANPISTNQGFKSIVPYILECSRFIATAMTAFAPEIDAKAPGTTFKEVSGKIVAAIPFPLPPLAEQHRIIARVDELMGLCDRLEAARADRETVRDRLSAASLARLNAPDPEAFEDDANFAFNALPALTKRPDQVKALRQTILNLAVSGKLVKQDANEESAEELLSRKCKAGGNVNLRRAVPEIVEMPNTLDAEQLPTGWCLQSIASLLRIGAIVDLKDGNHGANHPKISDFVSTGIPFITAAQVSETGQIDYEGTYKLDGKPLSKLKVGFAKKGDVIYTHKGSVGRVALCYHDCVLSPQTTYYRPDESIINNAFLRIMLLSDQYRFQVDAVKKQTTRDFVSIQKQYGFFIYLPPIAEQSRIVAKVNKLMVLCDKLEASLTAATDTRRRLLDALLAEALASDEDRLLEAAE
ncbi:restriction endonuclease subunit S [Methylobacterium sp. Leaf123]|uniref:restriction endonuclease subunit S n=1 Tax=Methylobacterium sp. Leaf123 TaxID=1736264 RepID=UPI0009EC8222|nr:restriction endonuclease subunit S [Methylobacterium sp. Leaf123]